MKSTGIVRRIDDLGRVVIPKEVRRNMGIREGDPLEIYTDRDGYVIFKKYEPNNTNEIAEYILQSARTLGFEVGVYDDLGCYRCGSRFGAVDNKIDIDNVDLIKVVDEDIRDRAYLYIKVTKLSESHSLEVLKGIATMATVMIN